MKPNFIVRETQDGGFAVFRFNASSGLFEQHSPKTGSISKEDAEEMCEECNHLAEEETTGYINNSKPENQKPKTRRVLPIIAVIVILILAISTIFLIKPATCSDNSETSTDSRITDAETSDEIISFLDEEGPCVVPEEYSWIYGGWENADGYRYLITKKGIRNSWDENIDIRRLEPIEFSFEEFHNKHVLSYKPSWILELDRFRDNCKRIEITDSKKERDEYRYNLENHPAQGSWQESEARSGGDRYKFTINKDRYESGDGNKKVVLLKDGNLLAENLWFIYDAEQDALFLDQGEMDPAIKYERIK